MLRKKRPPATSTAVFLTAVCVCSCLLPAVAPEDDDVIMVYTMVIDAALIETRLHLYTIQVRTRTIHGIQILDEKTLHATPGLPSFANDSASAVRQIENLITEAVPALSRPLDDNLARDYVLKKKTIYQLTFQATSGMKILQLWDKAASSDLMDSIRAMLLSKYDKRITICRQGCFEVVRGQEIGLHSFIAVNYMLKKFKARAKLEELEMDEYVGVIEMNGASFDIAFPPYASGYPKPDGCAGGVNGKFSAFLKKQCIYSMSYLFYGTKMAQLRMLGLPEECLAGRCGGGNSSKKDQPSPLNKEYESECLNPQFRRTVPIFLNNSVLVKGKANSLTAQQRFDLCYSLAVDRVLNHSSIQAVGEREFTYDAFYLVRLFYRVLFTLRLLPAEGDTITLKKLEEFGHVACTNPGTGGLHEPFYCMNLAYFTALLRHGLGFVDEQKFIIKEKIEGINVGWALGAALQSAVSGD